MDNQLTNRRFLLSSMAMIGVAAVPPAGPQQGGRPEMAAPNLFAHAADPLAPLHQIP